MVIVFAILMAFIAIIEPSKGFFSVALTAIALGFVLLSYPSLFIGIIIFTVVYLVYRVLKNNL